MKQLKRLVSICVLTVSLFGIVLGGETQTPPVASPLPAAECSEIEASMPVPNSSVDIVTEATTMFVTWLEAAIL